jgi:hypothetical protein
VVAWLAAVDPQRAVRRARTALRVAAQAVTVSRVTGTLPRVALE